MLWASVAMSPPNVNRLNLQHLRYLVALVSEGHVSRAAERMGVGQPAMSTALGKLRILFDDPLLVKTSTGMEPTQRALELARRAQEALDLLSGARNAGRVFDPASAEGHIRFMSSEGISDVVLPEFMKRVRERAPGLRFTFSPGDIRRTAEYLRDGQVEFVMGFLLVVPPELHQALLYPQRVVCIASRHHPAIQGSLSLEQFTGHGHVVWGAPPVPYPTLEVLVDETLERKGTARRVVLRASSMTSSAAVVASTDLLAVVPERVAYATPQAHELQVLDLPFPVMPFDVQLLWHERWHKDPVHAWVRQTFREVASVLQSKLGRPPHPASAAV
ncbi:MAG: LysR family transcriptional regulator [Pseudomonadota bacterium]